MSLAEINDGSTSAHCIQCARQGLKMDQVLTEQCARQGLKMGKALTAQCVRQGLKMGRQTLTTQCARQRLKMGQELTAHCARQRLKYHICMQEMAEPEFGTSSPDYIFNSFSRAGQKNLETLGTQARKKPLTL